MQSLVASFVCSGFRGFSAVLRCVFEWRGKRQFYTGQEHFLAECLLELYELQELTGEYAAEVKRL
jgi:hypothetical protein